MFLPSKKSCTLLSHSLFFLNLHPSFYPKNTSINKNSTKTGQNITLSFRQFFPCYLNPNYFLNLQKKKLSIILYLPSKQLLNFSRSTDHILLLALFPSSSKDQHTLMFFTSTPYSYKNIWSFALHITAISLLLFLSL